MPLPLFSRQGEKNPEHVSPTSESFRQNLLDECWIVEVSAQGDKGKRAPERLVSTLKWLPLAVDGLLFFVVTGKKKFQDIPQKSLEKGYDFLPFGENLTWNWRLTGLG